MSKTKTPKKQAPAKKTKGSRWTDDQFRTELNHFRSSLRRVFTFTDRMRRNKVRHPEPLKDLIGQVNGYANNVIQMFPTNTANPRLNALEKKRAEIDRQIASINKVA